MSEVRFLSVLYHPWKFESDIFIRLEGDRKTSQPSKNQENYDISKVGLTSSKQKQRLLNFYNYLSVLNISRKSIQPSPRNPLDKIGKENNNREE